ncbi:F-box/FBD/LRR-repeat protein At1g13570-like isoform X2 [Rutidosis leptorrhynchoides]
MMEPVDGKKSKFASENDVISRLPDNVITHILDRLPLQEAVRTDILSRTWRRKWNALTKLVFDEAFFEYLNGPNGKKASDSSLGRLLLHFKGTITKFVFYLPDPYAYHVDVEDLNHWVLFVCRKELQEFELLNFNDDESPIKLPSQLFTCTGLKHLKLRLCAIRFLPTFHGFPNLLSLDLENIDFDKGKCGNFIALCPLLEILKIIDDTSTCAVNFDVILKLVNLKVLSLSMGFVLDKTTPITSLDIIQLMCLLTKLQELNLDFNECKFIAEAPDVPVDQKVPNTFLCLRDLKLSHVDFGCDNFVSFVIEMISGSPNLHTLEIRVTYDYDFTTYTRSSLVFDCSKMGPLQLQNVVIDDSRGSANEAQLIKYILACSPLLKKIVINSYDTGKKFWLAKKLLTFHRVSPVAQIYLK